MELYGLLGALFVVLGAAGAYIKSDSTTFQKVMMGIVVALGFIVILRSIAP